jgi:hypothetical protein
VRIIDNLKRIRSLMHEHSVAITMLTSNSAVFGDVVFGCPSPFVISQKADGSGNGGLASMLPEALSCAPVPGNACAGAFFAQEEHQQARQHQTTQTSTV